MELPEMPPWLVYFLLYQLVFLVFVVVGRIYVRWRGLGKDKKTPQLAIGEFPKPELSRSEKLREQVMNAAIVVCAVLFWPIALAAIVYDHLFPHGLRERPMPRFDCQVHHLRRRVTPAQAEAEAIITDPKGRVPSKPFGHLYDGWKRFVALGESRDELWIFKILGEPYHQESQTPWRRMTGQKEGFAWVRGGKVRAEFFTQWDSTD